MNNIDLSSIESKYKVLKAEYLDDIKSEGIYLKHIKSGARVCIISNDDTNKVFSIGFRTPPANSTGVAHILEHSVLCGSEKFPVKDPFIELAKGSLNTFLNAMTYPDKTVYPVASYNDKDFDNLCDIYMDAVLHPNIYKKPEIFLQEGWRYEVDETGEFTINGVVYNEMKGVFSSPEQILNRALSTSLFPDTTYGMESGGDPEDIPKLSYEEFLDFHRTYYHPSNSYITFYGDMNVVDKLNWLDEAYLSEYDEIKVDSEIPYQAAFDQMNVMEITYPIGDNEELDEKNYLAYNAVCPSTLDNETCIAMDVLSYCLIDSPGAPLKKKLLAKKICKDVFGGSNNGILQPYFSVAIKDSGIKDGAEYEKIVKDILTEIVKEGIDPMTVKAAISRFEFSHREASFDSFPKGLVYALGILDSWLYCDESPFEKLHENKIYAALKEKADTGYFEELIKKYLINNPHESVVVLTPDPEYNAKAEERLKNQIDEIKASLSDKELKQIKENGKKLKEYQEKVDTKEELACIPRLKREDLSDKIVPTSNICDEIEGVKTIYHNVNSNGISYIDLYFNLGQMDEKLVPYMGIFDAIFSCIRTKNYSLTELNNAIDLNTGGISCETMAGRRFIDGKYMYHSRISTRVLQGNVGAALDLITEILTNSDYTDEEQVAETIMEIKSRLAMEIMGSGHRAALRRSLACFESDSAFTELTKGIAFYEFVYDLEKDFEERKDEIVDALNKITKMVFNKDNLMVSITCDEENLLEVMEGVKKFANGLEATAGFVAKKCLADSDLTFDRINEGIKLPGSVCFVARGGVFDAKENPYNGALIVLKTILSYEYLWKNVREQGGAYGCMCSFLRAGKSYFVSYRDPNLDRTLKVYDKVYDYIKDFQADEDEMTKYIIGAISGVDSPMTPIARGRRDMGNYLNGLEDSMMAKSKKEILTATEQTIRSLKDIIKSFFDQSSVCVLGSAGKIDECKDEFDTIKELKL